MIGLRSILPLAIIAMVLSMWAGLACQRAQFTGPTVDSNTKIQGDASATATTAAAFPAIPDQNHLHNAHYVTAKVIAGAQPEGEASFEALRAMGVKTILSVDGAAPDVAMAHKFGLTYVHLPITYSGVKPEEGAAIAKALAELPGPIYVHCHHGKHRSAAAVAVACVINGTLAPEKAESVLQTFGTGENYKGLWKAARDARPLPAGELKAVKVSYVESQKIPPLAEAMVMVDQRWDRIKAVQKAGWKTPADHPDLDPPHEALQLEELLHELTRTDAVHQKPAEFQRLLAEGDEASRGLRMALSASAAAGKSQGGAASFLEADAAFKRIGNACAACHKAYRD